MPKVYNLVGQRFTRLTVKELLPTRKDKNKVWRCICVCGNLQDVTTENLVSHNTKSCGCLKIDLVIKRNFKHGKAGSFEYRVFNNLKNRCQNPNVPSFKDYGTRGIKVLWQTFEDFYEAVGPAPSQRHTIERIDNNGHYTTDNVRWATKLEQANNKRNNHLITFRNKTQTIAQWAREVGLDYHTLLRRLGSQWDLEDALFLPVNLNKSSKFNRLPNNLDTQNTDPLKD